MVSVRRWCVFLVGFPSCAIAQVLPDPAQMLPSQMQVEQFQDMSLGVGVSEARPLSQLSLQLIRVFEGWVAKPYNDASQYCTIGYGHLIALKPCEALGAELTPFSAGLDESEGLDLLHGDTKIARSFVSKLVEVDLNDDQFGALTSLVFNIGAANFERSTLLKYLNNEEYEAASNQFSRWIKSKGVVYNGLIARRNCERKLFEGGLELDANGSIDRTQCEDLGVGGNGEPLLDIETGE